MRENRERREREAERESRRIGKGKMRFNQFIHYPFSNSSNLFIGLQLHRLTTITENTTNATNKETHDMYYYYILGVP